MNRTFAYAQVEFNLYDGSGALVGSTLANINNLEPGVTWRFEAPILEQNVATARYMDFTAF